MGIFGRIKNVIVGGIQSGQIENRLKEAINEKLNEKLGDSATVVEQSRVDIISELSVVKRDIRDLKASILNLDKKADKILKSLPRRPSSSHSR